MDKVDIYRRIKHSKVVNKDVKILELCKAKSVLDIGCVGQDKNLNNPDWLHGKILKVATSIVGVDIDKEGIDQLKKQGLSVFTEKEIKEKGVKYQVILMADVIEHVNDPVSFLSDYSALLNDDGIFIITTPNATRISNSTGLLLINHFSVNPEHTFWFCSKTIVEVANRAGLKFKDFYWLKEYFSMGELKGFVGKLLFVINLLFSKLRRSFNPNFMIILKKY